MNGFRKSGYAGSRFLSHSKWAGRRGAKLVAAALAVFLPVALAGCSHTPTYKGPPNLIIHVLMKKWVIVPNHIVVPQGAKVELIVTSADVEHGIGVPGLDINQPVQPGHTTIVRFLAKKPGDYFMHCSVLCGRGHDRMTGDILITPKPEKGGSRAGKGSGSGGSGQSGTPVHK